MNYDHGELTNPDVEPIDNEPKGELGDETMVDLGGGLVFSRRELDLIHENDRLRAAIINARRGLWWFIERDTGEGWGWDESDADEISARAMEIQDKTLGAALDGLVGLHEQEQK